jgi:hypothetical protein
MRWTSCWVGGHCCWAAPRVTSRLTIAGSPAADRQVAEADARAAAATAAAAAEMAARAIRQPAKAPVAAAAAAAAAAGPLQVRAIVLAWVSTQKKRLTSMCRSTHDGGARTPRPTCTRRGASVGRSWAARASARSARRRPGCAHARVFTGPTCSLSMASTARPGSHTRRPRSTASPAPRTYDGRPRLLASTHLSDRTHPHVCRNRTAFATDAAPGCAYPSGPRRHSRHRRGSATRTTAAAASM